MEHYQTDCRYFTGYRPCGVGERCEGCEHFVRADPEILLINLDAMGDVLRTTALLPAIRRLHPNARITWLTRSVSAPLLRGNPDVDRVLELGVEADIVLRRLHFDLVLNADKSMVAGAVAVSVQAKERRGFGIDERGGIFPLNESAQHLFEMGLDDAQKFFGNQRTAPDLLAEALGFEHCRDEYWLGGLTPSEKPKRGLGFNTGCGPEWPFKKLSGAVTSAVIRQVFEVTQEPVLLLGGPAEEAEHQRLVDELGDAVEATPLKGGVLVGAAELDRCDVVLSGDSLGMHMAIALGKHVVAWFGVTSPQEIDLYGRGIKVLADVGCAPCWKPQCNQDVPCADSMDPGVLAAAAIDCLTACREGRALNEVRGASWWRPR
jgi:heptosyltransferase-2